MVPAGIDNNSIVVTKGVVVTCNQRLLDDHLNGEIRADGLPPFHRDLRSVQCG